MSLGCNIDFYKHRMLHQNELPSKSIGRPDIRYEMFLSLCCLTTGRPCSGALGFDLG